MNAILLCAGLGRRLAPLTNFVPKPLIKIDKKITLLDYWIYKLVEEFKVEKILINVHYKSNLIKNYINQNKYKNKIIVKFEKKILGTGGSFIKNLNFFDNKHGLLVHSDNICEENLANFKKFCLTNMCNKINLGLLAFKTSDKKNSGMLEVKKKKLINFFEKNPKAPGVWANGGIFFINKNYYNKLINKSYFDFSKEVINENIHKAIVYKTNKFFLDIGTIKNLRKYKLKYNEKVC